MNIKCRERGFLFFLSWLLIFIRVMIHNFDTLIMLYERDTNLLIGKLRKEIQFVVMKNYVKV
jgi:hypothetical protein